MLRASVATTKRVESNGKDSRAQRITSAFRFAKALAARVGLCQPSNETCELITEAVMPPNTPYVRPIAILLGLVLLFLFALAPPSSASDPAAVIQNQPQIEVPALKPPSEGKPVLELPGNRPRLTADRELSRKITQLLHRDRLPQIDAQVFENAGGPKSVVLSGQVRTELDKHEAERKVRDLLKGSTVAIRNQIKVNLKIDSAPPPITAHQNELDIPQVGFISKRLLGCWSGTTSAKPVTWQTLSEVGSQLGYHADRLGLCVTWRDGKLEVTDASANNADPGSEMYGFIYRPVSASGTEIKLELKSWDLTDPNGYVAKGTARCTINPDDSVAYFLSLTTFLKGQAAVRSETIARLQREH